MLGLRCQSLYLALEAATRPAGPAAVLVRPDPAFWVLPAMLTGLLIAHAAVRAIGRRFVPPPRAVRASADRAGWGPAGVALAALAGWTLYGASWAVRLSASGIVFHRPFRPPAVYRWDQVRAASEPGRPAGITLAFPDGRVWSPADWPSSADDDGAAVARFVARLPHRPTSRPIQGGP